MRTDPVAIDPKRSSGWPDSQYMNSRGSLGYSTLMLASLRIGHHLSISALWKVPSASGVCCSRGGTSTPRFASRERTAVSANASTTAALILSITTLGAPLGVQNANQGEA